MIGYSRYEMRIRLCACVNIIIICHFNEVALKISFLLLLPLRAVFLAMPILFLSLFLVRLIARPSKWYWMEWNKEKCYRQCQRRDSQYFVCWIFLDLNKSHNATITTATTATTSSLTSAAATRARPRFSWLSFHFDPLASRLWRVCQYVMRTNHSCENSLHRPQWFLLLFSFTPTLWRIWEASTRRSTRWSSNNAHITCFDI